MTIQENKIQSSSAQSPGAALYERALKVLPGGCSRNAILRQPHPIYAVRGEGCYVTDIDGVTRVDFANNMTSMIHGHAHPILVSIASEQMRRGSAFALGTELEVIFAEHMCSRSPSFEKIRFVNSGTEAVMGCVKAARAFTGRPKIAKMEGAYHGIYDYAETSQTANPDNWGDAEHPASVPVSHGTPQAALDDVIIIPFNEPEKALAILDQHSDDIACVLIDPMPHRVGLVAADDEFVQALRSWTTKNGALLVFDEVITYRFTHSGAQGWHPSIKPDLTALGKMIGGGFPVGALAGRADVMDVMNPLAEKVLFPHSGTYSANPVTMAAGLAAMEIFDHEAVDRLNELGDYTRRKLEEAIKLADVPACVTGRGSMYRIHLKEKAPHSYRDAYVGAHEAGLIKQLLEHFVDDGLMLINTCSVALSTVMQNAEIDRLAESTLRGLEKIKPHLQD